MKIIGNAPVLTSVTRSFSKANGWVTVIVYSGHKRGIEALGESLRSGADSIDIQPGDPEWKLSATYNNAQDGSTEQPTVVWEFPSNMQEVSLLQMPNALLLPDTVLENLRAYIDKSFTRAVGATVAKVNGRDAWRYADDTAGADIVEVYGDVAPTGGTLPGDGIGLAIIGLLAIGAENHKESVLVARVSTTVSGSYAIQVSNDITGLCISASNFDTLMNPPSDVRLSLPDGTSPITLPAGWRWGWIPQAPDIEQIGSGRWRIVQEFWWLLSHEIEYPDYSP